MGLVALHELCNVLPQLVVGVGRDMMELVHCHKPVIERLNTVLINGESKGGVCAHQDLLVTLEKRLHRLDLAAVLRPRSVAEIPLRCDVPIRDKAEIGERLRVEASSDGPLRNHDYCLLDFLFMELVEGYEHQGTAVTRGWRGLD